MGFLMEFGLEFWLKRRKERQIAYVRRTIGDAAKEEEEYLPPGISHKAPSSETVERTSYSIYMVHWLPIVLAAAQLKHIVPKQGH